MLTPELVEALQAPISDASPAGDDLEYDPAFTALAASAEGKPEQQFGDTVIPAVEPEWRVVADEARAVLGRAKDVRVAVLLLRASTRQQGLAGFAMALDLLTALLDRYWDGIHPLLDADDDNDPTMRLNALAPLADESMVLRDLYDARLGVARGVGPVRVRDVAVAHNALPASGDGGYSPAQVEGALAEIHAESPDALQPMQDLLPRIVRLQTLIAERTGRSDLIDLSRARTIAQVLQRAAASVMGTPAADADAAEAAAGASGNAGRAASAGSIPRGDIQTRQDALQMLDRVIHYLQQTEPGNPAPLLIARAKKLIGVSFMEIMADLAPNALDTIETVTGKQAVDS